MSGPGILILSCCCVIIFISQLKYYLLSPGLGTTLYENNVSFIIYSLSDIRESPTQCSILSIEPGSVLTGIIIVSPPETEIAFSLTTSISATKSFLGRTVVESEHCRKD